MLEDDKNKVLEKLVISIDNLVMETANKIFNAATEEQEFIRFLHLVYLNLLSNVVIHTTNGREKLEENFEVMKVLVNESFDKVKKMALARDDWWIKKEVH